MGNRWWFRISRVPLTSWGPCDRDVVEKPKLKWTNMTCRFIPPKFAFVNCFLLCPNFARGGITPQQQGLSSSCRNAFKSDVSRRWFSSLYKKSIAAAAAVAVVTVVVVVLIPPHPYHWGPRIFFSAARVVGGNLGWPGSTKEAPAPYLNPSFWCLGGWGLVDG